MSNKNQKQDEHVQTSLRQRLKPRSSRIWKCRRWACFALRASCNDSQKRKHGQPAQLGQRNFRCGTFTQTLQGLKQNGSNEWLPSPSPLENSGDPTFPEPTATEHLQGHAPHSINPLQLAEQTCHVLKKSTFKLDPKSPAQEEVSDDSAAKSALLGIFCS